LPANTHRPAMELTLNFLRRSPSAVKKIFQKILRRRFQAGIYTNKHESALINRRRGGSAVQGQQSINYASTNATPTPVRPLPCACYKMRATDARCFPGRNCGWPARTAMSFLPRCRATLSFGTPWITKDKTLALLSAVPMGRKPGIVDNACCAYSNKACS